MLAICCGSKMELEVQAGSAALLVCGGLLVLLELVCQFGGLLVCYWVRYFGGLLVHKLSYWRRIISLLVDSAGLLVCTGLLVLSHRIISLLDY